MAIQYFAVKRAIRDALAADPGVQATGATVYYGKRELTTIEIPAIIVYSQATEEEQRALPIQATGSKMARLRYWVRCVARSTSSREEADTALDPIADAVEDALRNTSNAVYAAFPGKIASIQVLARYADEEGGPGGGYTSVMDLEVEVQRVA